MTGIPEFDVTNMVDVPDLVAEKRVPGEMLCLSRAEVEALTLRLKFYAFGYTDKSQAAAKVVRRMLDWLEPKSGR